ncbi:MAG: eukaryotic-like serine/threonine-protein kinase [Verrucomicrobiota bacterium]|jgi:serine/threonine-protein kinase
MEQKIFLGKYRVARDEMAQVSAEPASVTMAAATEQLTTARIYRGDDMDSGRDVTIEVVPVGAFKPSVRTKLEEEATAAKQINHINIPALYDFGIEDDQLVYVTEYFDGTSAEDWVNQHGPMPTGAVLRIALQVMSAMGAAAFHKISHHAINPGNLMLVPGQTPEGDWPLVKVLHFLGVAPTFTSSGLSVASFDKSTHYVSPEQLQGQPVDFRSEIYSLGATMWFLLTGAPPLIAPKGPLAMQPSTIGLAVDKLQGMPKRVRRLLAQMLSVDPAARPQDPLAVYRQIQDCVAQVERRESMARKFGVPFVSGPKVAALPRRRPISTKLVALAAIVIALATIASISVASYLRHQRVRQAEAPIGVPIGVTQPAEAAPPVTTSAPTIVPAPPQPEQTAPATVAQQTEKQAPPVTTSAATIKPLPTAPEQTVPADVAANQPPAKIESAPPVVANQPPPAPVEPAATAPPANNPPAEAPKVAANETKAVEENVEPAQSRESVRTEPREEKPRRNPQVAAARPASPEVRKAEPPPPAEGPEEVAPAPEKKVTSTTTTKKERAKKPKREVTEEEPVAPSAEPAGDEEVAATEPPPMPQLPRGRTRAKFIGVTADGNWMFSLPNKKIVVVPPPPGG